MFEYEDEHTKNMVETYEKSFGTEALFKLCLSNIHRVLIGKNIISEKRLKDLLRLEIEVDIRKRANEATSEKIVRSEFCTCDSGPIVDNKPTMQLDPGCPLHGSRIPREVDFHSNHRFKTFKEVIIGEYFILHCSLPYICKKISDTQAIGMGYSSQQANYFNPYDRVTMITDDDIKMMI